MNEAPAAESAGAQGTSAPRWFVLQARDPATDCAVLEARFAVADLAQLRCALGGMADDDPDLDRCYGLDPADVSAIVTAFGVAFDPGDRGAVLAPWQSFREVPYLVHTGFELTLMLEGRKPLAVFSSTDPCEGLDGLMRRFDPFVAEGRFVRRKVTVPMPKPWCAPDGTVVDRLQQVYVALRGEEWRIDAFILLRDVEAKAGWSEGLEGSLLGYEDWHNDWWRERRRRIAAG